MGSSKQPWAKRPWEWRKGREDLTFATDPAGRFLFHAFDPTGICACQPSIHLATSYEEPTESSALCLACLEVVQTLPTRHGDTAAS